jgi:hypothetical protein
MRKLAFLVAVGIACLFISAPFVLAADLGLQHIEWVQDE